MMMWWRWDDFGPSWVGGWFMTALMALVWIAVIVGIVLLVRAVVHRGTGSSMSYQAPVQPGSAGPPGSDLPAAGPPSGGRPTAQPSGSAPASGAHSAEALRILEERYARGEIEREDFLQRKADISS